MTVETMVAFAIAMFILAVTPGPGIFASVSQAMTAGFRSALDVIAGIVLGDLIFLALAVYGLSAIAYALGNLFYIIKWIGGIYLIWLGWKMWRQEPHTNGSHVQGRKSNRRQRFTGGLLITLANPKVILFYAGFMPTFLDLHRLQPIDFIMVAGVVSVVLTGVMTLYAYSASRARQFFSGRKARLRLNQGAGTVMIGAGVIILNSE